MALTDEGNSGIPATMLVGPASVGNTMPYYPYPVQGGGSGMGNGWGDGAWIILLIIVLLAAGGGWGNSQNGGGFGGGTPIIVNDGNNGVQRGFDQAAVMSGIGAIQSGVQGLSTQICGGVGDIQSTLSAGFNSVNTALCNGFAGVNAGVANGFAQAEIANNGRQMANMNQMFGMQTALAQGFNQLGTQFADCCCENRLASCQTQNIIQSEASATRFADANNTRDIIQSQSNGTQAILDKLCQLELDGVKAQVEAKNDRIADLQRQLSEANLSASQTAQNAFIQQGFANEVDALYNRLSNCPVPTTPVYGRTPIFTCPQNQTSCGCGCGNF